MKGDLGEDEVFNDRKRYKVSDDYIVIKPFSESEKRKLSIATKKLESTYGKHYTFTDQVYAGMREGLFHKRNSLDKNE